MIRNVFRSRICAVTWMVVPVCHYILDHITLTFIMCHDVSVEDSHNITQPYRNHLTLRQRTHTGHTGPCQAASGCAFLSHNNCTTLSLFRFAAKCKAVLSTGSLNFTSLSGSSWIAPRFSMPCSDWWQQRAMHQGSHSITLWLGNAASVTSQVYWKLKTAWSWIVPSPVLHWGS